MTAVRTLALVALLVSTASAQPAKPDNKAPAAEKKAEPKSDQKSGREEIPTETAEKYLGFFNKLMDTIVQNKDSCTKMAAGINAHVDANHELVVQMNKDKADGKKMPKAIEEKMQARVKEMVPAMQRCGTDKEVQAAIKRMDTKPAAKK
jgi:hypothetical protein